MAITMRDRKNSSVHMIPPSDDRDLFIIDRGLGFIICNENLHFHIPIDILLLGRRSGCLEFATPPPSACTSLLYTICDIFVTRQVICFLSVF